MDTEKIRLDFPVLQKHPKLVYFDNACTTLKPAAVIGAIASYYSEYSACAGRSNHALSRRTDEEFTKARETVAKFAHSNPDNVVWMRNTTEGINTVAEGFDFSKKRKVVISSLEHHSLLLPFQRLAQEKKIELAVVKPDAQGMFSGAEWDEAIDERTALVATNMVNNTTGTSPPIARIIKNAHYAGAQVLLDGAQGVAHGAVDFQKLDADFIAFSSHKMCGPTGIGALLGKQDALESLRTHNIGGETISTATLDSHVMLPVPKRFEAGIQHYDGAIGFAAACNYLQKIGMEKIAAHESSLIKSLQQKIEDDSALYNKISILGPADPRMRHSAIFSFRMEKIPPHQVSIMLDKLSSIAVRSGLFCAHPAMAHFGAPEGAVRASLYLYNTEGEVDKFVQALKQVGSLS